MAQLNFDARTVAPDTGFDTVPPGWYNVMMVESELKATKQGNGAYLNCAFNILDGQFANRKIFARINLQNPNPVAQEIGFKQLSAIAHAVGVLQVADSSQLHNIPLKVKVKIRKDKEGEYEDQNEITSYKNINEQVGAAPAAPAGAPAFAPPPAAPTVPQWAPPPATAPASAQPWTAAPAAPAAPVAPAQPWAQPPQAPAQPWAQPQAAAPPAAPPSPPAAPAAFNPQTAVPPWAQPR